MMECFERSDIVLFSPELKAHLQSNREHQLFCDLELKDAPLRLRIPNEGAINNLWQRFFKGFAAPLINLFLYRRS